jgi:hypothetical protein
MEQMSVFLKVAHQSLTKVERRRYSYFIRKASKDNGLCQILLEPPPAAVAVTPSPKKRPCSNHGSDSSSTTKKQKKEPCPTDLNPVFEAVAEVQLKDDDDDVSSCGELELAQVNLNEYRLVSIAQGLESWDEKMDTWEDVVLFCHETHRTILLQYPNEYNPITGDCVWEGMLGSHGYTLSMKQNQQQPQQQEALIMFNGENGILLDADGDEILCRIKKNNTLPSSSPCIMTASADPISSDDAVVVIDSPVTTTTEITLPVSACSPCETTVHVVRDGGDGCHVPESSHSPVASSETEPLFVF